jgi:hypothetical protein
MRHVSELPSPTLVFASAIVLEQQSAVPRDKNAMDIGLADAVQPRDQTAKNLAPKAGTFWIGDIPVRETHGCSKGREDRLGQRTPEFAFELSSLDFG